MNEHRQADIKDKLLTRSAPSAVASISDAVVIKNADVFFLCDGSGDVPIDPDREAGLGLYYHDCRFLSGYELSVCGRKLHPIAASAADDYRCLLELTNPSGIESDNGKIAKEELALRWERELDGRHVLLRDQIHFRHYGHDTVNIAIDVRFAADFEDIFVVRGLLDKDPGTRRPPRVEEQGLLFSQLEKDGVRRTTSIRSNERPERACTNSLHFTMALEPKEERTLTVTILLAEQSDAKGGDRSSSPRTPEHLQKDMADSINDWMDGFVAMQSDSADLNATFDRSLRDLRMLRNEIHGKHFPAAGTPWYATLFGRDSIIAAIQMLAYRPELGEETLQLLAELQGQSLQSSNDEQPGRMPHELRVGELARAGIVPYSPYFGTVDATPLFLVLLGLHARWSGSLELFHSLHSSVEAALEWMTTFGDSDRDGFLDYESPAPPHVTNFGWKDSGNAIVDRNGSLATPPIALVEVQGYAYLARLLMADLYARDNQPERAQGLRDSCDRLQERFDRAFWVEDRACYALALHAGGKQAGVVSSNAGQALWTGIVPEHRAGAVVARLMSDSMFSGWGVRTLSSEEAAFNPLGYHLGTVWPHDNSIIVAGLRRYGFDAEAQRLFGGILAAAPHFRHRRLPETFAGFSREDYEAPVSYPVACHPQAWAAGSVPFMLQTMLGLEPDGFNRRLRVVRPSLPDGVNCLELRGVRVGDGSVDLEFVRSASGHILVQIIGKRGSIDVVLDQTIA